MSKIEMKNIATMARHGSGDDRVSGFSFGLIASFVFQAISDEPNRNLWLVNMGVFAVLGGVLWLSGRFCKSDADKLIAEIIVRATTP